MPLPLSILDLVPLADGQRSADEVMIASHIIDAPGRLRSYTLLAEAWGRR